MLKIKHRRGELTLTREDIVMYNRACYQLITQKYRDGWYETCYILSQATCKKLIKNGELVLVNSNEKDGLDYYQIKKENNNG